MATIPQIRGALLEEAVLFLLGKVGYSIVDVDDENSAEESGLWKGPAGLFVAGRGTWHQIDALASFDHTPAFMYPLRLMVEAKCYKPGSAVGLPVVRNSVGVLKDISENYFTTENDIQVARYNYHAAIFSTSGYTQPAVDYALAHQIFLIQYKNVPIIQPLIEALLSFDEECITDMGKENMSNISKYYRELLINKEQDFPGILTEYGRYVLEESYQSIKNIKGSYFGMLQGRWPIHMLRYEPLFAEDFKEDIISCKIIIDELGALKITPRNAYLRNYQEDALEFDLPKPIAKLIMSSWGD